MEIINRLSDDIQYLTRFIDIHKLISIIDKKGFYFSRLDSFEDKLEALSLNQLKELLHPNSKKDLKPRELKLRERQRDYFALCWFGFDRESFAMWDKYSNKSSVAIRLKLNDFNMLWEEFNIFPDEDLVNRIYIDKVDYLDYLSEYEIEKFNSNNRVLGLKKDISFSFEKEVRVLLKGSNKLTDDTYNFLVAPNNFNDIELDVIFHPKMEEWKKENIKRLFENFKMDNFNFINSELKIFLDNENTSI